MMKPIIAIPSRLAATRFPNKPMALVGGVPMVLKIFKQAQEADIAPVIVAAGDKEIYTLIKDNGGEAVLTDPDLPSGTDRVAAAVDQYDQDKKYNVVINLQGDLAIFNSDVLKACLHGFEYDRENFYDIATVCTLIKDKALIDDPNTAKAVITFNENQSSSIYKTGRALYFTRSTCPYGDGEFYQHLGVYAYRRNSLQKFINLPPSQLELREKLEQLRGLEAGFNFAITLVDHQPLEVNTLEDLVKINNKLR